ncbi:electron transporter RnfA [Pantoea sp. Tr-811]|uniref:Rnf-Nqr domain containing protein n=1 Tax=Pantoea sp. Tr-811 TaxID=2608361 RepID=UPI001422885F|nr:Rnf-Nqr domain containing protein [Pantoea sp. Tr-811]NIF25788.1 electron transporter RnfA [Pantoea sp. Tr-811]
MNDYVLTLLGAALVSHVLLPPSRLPGFGLACAVTTALGVCGGRLIEHWLIAPWQLEDLRLFLLLPWLAVLAWAGPLLLARLRPGMISQGLGTPILGNALVLGLALPAMAEHTPWLATLGWGIGAGLGFWLALTLFADLQQRTEHEQLPRALRGLPIALIGAGIMAMACSGLNGLFTQ